MNRHIAFIGVCVAILALLLAIAGCTTPAVNSPAAAASPSAAVTTASGASTSPSSAAANTSAVASATVATTAPAATVKAPAADAFKFYKLIDIDMTKDAVDKAIGVAPKAATGKNDPPNSYYYLDGDGVGVYVQFDKNLKLTDKTVQYTSPADALTPYTTKPVTQGECDKIVNGMTPADVVKLLGSEGAECSKTKSIVFEKATIGTIYRWGNQDGSFIQVVFLSNGTASNAMFFD